MSDRCMNNKFNLRTKKLEPDPCDCLCKNLTYIDRPSLIFGQFYDFWVCDNCGHIQKEQEEGSK